MTDSAQLVERWFALGLDPDAAMARPLPGPSVEELGARLSSVPREFLDPRLGLAALADDVLVATPGPAASAVAASRTLVATAAPEPVTAAAVVLWLYASETVVGPYTAPLLVPVAVDRLLLTVGLRVAPLNPPTTWLTSEDAREEVVRTVLWWSGLLPAGEDLRTARAMLQVHDSVARHGTLRRAREAYEHRLAVNKRLREARAKEAAQRYTNE